MDKEEEQQNDVTDLYSRVTDSILSSSGYSQTQRLACSLFSCVCVHFFWVLRFLTPPKKNPPKNDSIFLLGVKDSIFLLGVGASFCISVTSDQD